MINSLCERLSRYSEQCIAERLDADFAAAVRQAIARLKVDDDTISFLRGSVDNYNSELKDCKNELCQWCGKYRSAHIGACNECKWRMN